MVINTYKRVLVTQDSGGAKEAGLLGRGKIRILKEVSCLCVYNIYMPQQYDKADCH